MSAPCPVFGATVHARLRADADVHSLLERFDELLASRGLVRSVGSGRTWSFVVSSEAGQMTEGDRQAVVRWLAAESAFNDATVTPIGDVR